MSYKLTSSTLDLSKKAIQGATVQELNAFGFPSGNNTQTSADGTFTLAVDSSLSIVRVSCEGYKDFSMPANAFGAYQLMEGDIVIPAKTGKSSNMGLWIGGVILLGTGIFVATRKSTKSKSSPKRVTI